MALDINLLESVFAGIDVLRRGIQKAEDTRRRAKNGLQQIFATKQKMEFIRCSSLQVYPGFSRMDFIWAPDGMMVVWDI